VLIKRAVRAVALHLHNCRMDRVGETQGGGNMVCYGVFLNCLFHHPLGNLFRVFIQVLSLLEFTSILQPEYLCDRDDVARCLH